MKENPETRSRIMRAVKGKHTKPELVVRHLAYAMGYRYRLHRKDLPGKPDLVFPKLRKVIFVHGCFWHGHNCARGSRIPVQNREYWLEKIGRNRERDHGTIAALTELGWKITVLWECEVKDQMRLRRILSQFLR